MEIKNLAKSNTYLMIKRLWAHIESKRRLQILLLFLLMLLTSFAEVISIGAIVPFLSVLVSPSGGVKAPFFSSIVEFIDSYFSGNLLACITLIFVFSAVMAGLLRLVTTSFQVRLSHSIGAEFSIAIYERTLYQPYIVHLSRNSSEVIGGIINKSSSLVQNALYPLLTILASCLMLIMILGALFFINPLVSILTFTTFAGIYLIIIYGTQLRLARESALISVESNKVVKVLQEGLGGIRDVLLDATQSVYVDIYKRSDIPLRKSLAYLQIIGASPRFVIEAFGISIISGVAYFLSYTDGGVEGAIPVLGALALGAQRLLPILQQGYAAFTSLRGGHVSVMDALDLLDQPVDKNKFQENEFEVVTPRNFNKMISLRNLGYRYSSDGPWIFRNVNLDIPKGSRIGIIGTTGSGKSTFLDVIMGLLSPTEGEIIVDNIPLGPNSLRAWQKQLAHVPQNIYLSDTSIAENIAFGKNLDEIDFKEVTVASDRAQIAPFIEKLKENYHTFVGERGVRLSGGQRQRIGIARALYKKSKIIIFDEATSALDSVTEDAVIKSIQDISDDLTIFMVAHRLSTLKNCEIILEVIDGTVLKKNYPNKNHDTN